MINARNCAPAPRPPKTPKHSRPLELCTTLLVSLGFAVESSDLNRQSLTPLVKAGSVNVSKIDSSSYHVVIRQPND
ncbi:hypothetical protein M438DRAFT_342653 [Aureobasidium pullulans EXF-150]|uniref:Uncharacterized protein n=1 Tax=Aureobasidium pullulans EXF-150 TaxID=1043002 RepID=A0A074XPP4_AURPU|nr:uncharacterized protein M438DRAFT_342653 [Aureobasidium pullulans EXF-150]KEQ87480.1 hypothetical protein M438DRAFT_342653 [Aureobasidium pullulans EXF-150]